MRERTLAAAERDVPALATVLRGTLATAGEDASSTEGVQGAPARVLYSVGVSILPTPGADTPTLSDLEEALTELGYTVDPSRSSTANTTVLPIIGTTTGTSPDGEVTIRLSFTQDQLDGEALVRPAHYSATVEPVAEYTVSTDDLSAFRAAITAAGPIPWAPPPSTG